MANFMAGFQAKSTIDGTPYAFATYRIRASGMRHNVSNTEGLAGNSALGNAPQLGAVANFTGVPCFESVLPGLDHLEATVRQATFDMANNPFLAPILLDIGFYYELIVFYAASGPNWAVDSFLVNEIDSDGDVNGLQPVSFSGSSDGGFTINP